jgi:hypothetical protein
LQEQRNPTAGKIGEGKGLFSFFPVDLLLQFLLPGMSQFHPHGKSISIPRILSTVLSGIAMCQFHQFGLTHGVFSLPKRFSSYSGFDRAALRGALSV